MTKMSGMNITPLNDEVAKGLDFADAMAGIGNGASLGSIGQNKKFAISYKTSVLVDNFQSGGSINMSSNSWKKFLQAYGTLREKSALVDNNDMVAPALYAATINFNATRSIGFRGLVFEGRLVIDEKANVNVTTKDVIKPNVIIQPKSITGLMSLKINDKKAHIVVKTV